RTLAALIGEEGCHAALAELTRVDSARPSSAGAPEPKLVIVHPPKAEIGDDSEGDAGAVPEVPAPAPERVLAPPVPPPVAVAPPAPAPPVIEATAPPPPVIEAA